MTSLLKFAAAIFVTLLLLDNIFPTQKIITEVYRITLNGKSGGEIFYNIPLTGGDDDSCQSTEEVIRKLPSGSHILVERSAIFNRCVRINPNPGLIDSAKLIEDAIRGSYEGVYSSLEELRRDYPGFAPKVLFWDEDSWSFGMPNLYSVNMPEHLVIFNKDGTVRTTRQCGSVGGYCETVIPANPEKGIVGTVQYGEPAYAIAENFELEWQDDPKAVFFKSGHCFSAYSQSSAAKYLIIRLQGSEPRPIWTGFGFFLVVNIGGSNAMQRISKADFIKSQSCSSKARAAWPDIGWSGWKR